MYTHNYYCNSYGSSPLKPVTLRLKPMYLLRYHYSILASNLLPLIPPFSVTMKYLSQIDSTWNLLLLTCSFKLFGGGQPQACLRPSLPTQCCCHIHATTSNAISSQAIILTRVWPSLHSPIMNFCLPQIIMINIIELHLVMFVLKI